VALVGVRGQLAEGAVADDAFVIHAPLAGEVRVAPHLDVALAFEADLAAGEKGRDLPAFERGVEVEVGAVVAERERHGFPRFG
jgi:hypothetical protein